MNNDERLAALIDAWQEAEARGAAVAPEELCRDCPALLPDLMRRIEVLRCFEALRSDEDGGTREYRPAEADTSEDARRAGAAPRGGPAGLPAVGEEFGGYRIVALLGEGGMGCVYRAADPVLRREVALKVVRPEIAVRPQARERFLREARALAAVEHDHVAPIYHVGEVNDVPFLTMPLLKGETLADRLAREKVLPVTEVLRVGREAAAGLAAAHARGLVHRDVKPRNIWLEADPAGRAKLLDFGLAREQHEDEGLTDEGVILGTPAYMSPEQADGQPLDHRSDLFSLGSVLYECATGQRPFQGKTGTAMLTAVARCQPPAAHEVGPSVPAELSALIARLQAKAPADRPDSALAVVEAIRAIEGGRETVQVLRTGPQPVRPGRPRRRWPWAAAVAAVMLLGLAVAAALRPWQKPTAASSAPGGEPAPAAGPLAAKLDVRVWKKADTSKGLDLGTAGALPLRAGDWMRVEVESSRPAYLYLIYLDARGEASPLFPWRKYDWDDRPPPQKLTRRHLPEDPLKVAPMSPGPSGIEAVLLLARDEPLSAEEVGRLRGVFETKAPAAKFDPLRGAVWLGAEERFGNAQDRGRPNLDQAGTVVDPVERMRRLVRDELKGLGDDVRGVCYPFEGK
jgi:hypothetical protein